MTFQPHPTRSGYVALVIAVLSGAAAIYLLNRILGQNDLSNTFQLFVALLLMVLITVIALYWVIIVTKLDYQLDRNGLAIQWGLAQYRVPLDAIETIMPGQEAVTSARFWEINFTGLRLGRGHLADHGPLKFRTTASLAESLLVVTPEQTYVVSPRQPSQFVKAWQDRQALGITQQWSDRVRRSWPLNSPLLADSLAWWLLGGAALLWLALAGYLALNFADLPTSLPVHFNALGRADRIAHKTALLVLPLAGAMVWLVNTLLGELIYPREKLAAYFLWGSTVVMQFCLWVALYAIVG